MILLELEPGQTFEFQGDIHTVKDHTRGRFTESCITTTTYQHPKFKTVEEMTFNSLTLIPTPPIP